MKKKIIFAAILLILVSGCIQPSAPGQNDEIQLLQEYPLGSGWHRKDDKMPLLQGFPDENIVANVSFSNDEILCKELTMYGFGEMTNPTYYFTFFKKGTAKDPGSYVRGFHVREVETRNYTVHMWGGCQLEGLEFIQKAIFDVFPQAYQTENTQSNGTQDEEMK